MLNLLKMPSPNYIKQISSEMVLLMYSLPGQDVVAVVVEVEEEDSEVEEEEDTEEEVAVAVDTTETEEMIEAAVAAAVTITMILSATIATRPAILVGIVLRTTVKVAVAVVDTDAMMTEHAITVVKKVTCPSNAHKVAVEEEEGEEEVEGEGTEMKMVVMIIDYGNAKDEKPKYLKVGISVK